MRQTVVAVFESPLLANDAVHVLEKARFDVERLPRVSLTTADSDGSLLGRLWSTIRRKLEALMDSDMYLQPYAQALARGSFVVKVYVDDDSEAFAVRQIVAAAGGREIDSLADERC